MLEKCLVGNYVNPAKLVPLNKNALKTSSTLQVLEKLQIPVLPAINLALSNRDTEKAPTMDVYQCLNKTTFVFYTKIIHIHNEFIIIYRDEKTNYLVIDIYDFDTVYEYKIGN